MDEDFDDRRVELTLLGIAPDKMAYLPKLGVVRPHRLNNLDCWWTLKSDLSANETWGPAIGRLIKLCNGEDALSLLIKNLNPKNASINIFVPFDAPYQENNGIEAAVVQLLGRLGLELGVIPVDFDTRNPTHLALGYD